MTVKELQQYLDGKEIEYKTSDSKTELQKKAGG